MTLRPCVVCGEPGPRSRCPKHRTKDRRVRKVKGNAAHDPAWRRLSARARRDQPWCQDCGSSSDLTADHIIPKSIAPELVHAPENFAVRCRSCNSRKADKFAVADALAVLDRLIASFNRHPTRAGRQRIAAAECSLTRGDAPSPPPSRPSGKANFELHTGAVSRGGGGVVPALLDRGC